MTRYHIAASGRPAVCKASSEATCPLGGQHFANKDTAEFYIQANYTPKHVRARGGVSPAERATQRKEAVRALDDEELRRRQHALTAVQMAEELGDEEDLREAQRKLERLDPVEGDPTWDLGEVNAEFLRRASAQESAAPRLDDLVIDEDEDTSDCDHRGTGRMVKFDGGRRAVLCGRCSKILRYESDGQPQVGMKREPMRDTSPQAPSYLTDSVYASVRTLDDRTLAAHHAALTKYKLAKELGTPEDLQAAAAGMQALGDPAAHYSWAPVTAQARVQAELLRRQASVALLQEEITERWTDAEGTLRDLSQARRESEVERLHNKRLGVQKFRELWGGRITDAAGYDAVRGVLREAAATQRAIEDNRTMPQPGWREGYELAYSYVEGYLRTGA